MDKKRWTKHEFLWDKSAKLGKKKEIENESWCENQQWDEEDDEETNQWIKDLRGKNESRNCSWWIGRRRMKLDYFI